jgi:hypothetical protein
MSLANRYVFSRRAIYYEEEIVYADTVKDAWEKVYSGDGDEINVQDFYDYYDDEYELMEVEEQDPFVNMILKYENEKQLELFD